MPSYLGVLLMGSFYGGPLLLAAAFFFDCMKMSSAKDVSFCSKQTKLREFWYQKP